MRAADYPDHMKGRRIDGNISRYLPFHELRSVDLNLQASPKEVLGAVKIHSNISKYRRFSRLCQNNKSFLFLIEEQVDRQLILWNENETGTSSESHVRLYAAAYTSDNVLLTETLHPPIRNSKIYEPLRILKIVQPKTQIHAGDTAYVYCKFDSTRLPAGNVSSPYTFELIFEPSSNLSNMSDTTQLFQTNSAIPVNAFYVDSCPVSILVSNIIYTIFLCTAFVAISSARYS